MKKNTTITGNELIAKFMGLKAPYYLPQFGKMKCNGDWKDTFESSELKYHCDWNWLMPVVEQIEQTSEFTGVLIYPRGCEIYEENLFSFSIDSDTKIKAIWTACVEFAKFKKQN